MLIGVVGAKTLWANEVGVTPSVDANMQRTHDDRGRSDEVVGKESRNNRLRESRLSRGTNRGRAKGGRGLSPAVARVHPPGGVLVPVSVVRDRVALLKLAELEELGDGVTVSHFTQQGQPELPREAERQEGEGEEGEDVHVLRRSEDGVELLLGRLAENSRRASSGEEDVERCFRCSIGSSDPGQRLV